MTPADVAARKASLVYAPVKYPDYAVNGVGCIGLIMVSLRDQGNNLRSEIETLPWR